LEGARRWRHLNTMQYRTIRLADVPRVQCDEHGVVQVAVIPDADQRIVFDKFYIAQHFGRAVDEVRRAENRPTRMPDAPDIQAGFWPNARVGALSQTPTGSPATAPEAVRILCRYSGQPTPSQLSSSPQPRARTAARAARSESTTWALSMCRRPAGTLKAPRLRPPSPVGTRRGPSLGQSPW
jgi:hypothetical protein